MRLISIDTETTGSSPAKGDRCVEIGAVELIDGRLTGRTFQSYLNPGRPVAWQAQRVHGLSDRFLADKPRFAEIAPGLLDFIGDAPCMAHNARFDRDMILYDFRGAGLAIPAMRFYDTLPLSKAHIRAPAYRLDVLAQSLGLIDAARGLHGALEDATILARVLERIEETRPGALQGWIRAGNALGPYPNGWIGAAPARTDPVRSASDPCQVAPDEAGDSSEEQEADRMAGLVRAALEGGADLPLFAKRLTGEGILVRPVLNGELTLHGVRFSTPQASFTGGSIGLTGSALERIGIRYLHPDHANLVRDLVRAHDAVMGNVQDLKGRYTAVPSGSPTRPSREVGAEARERLHQVIVREIPGTRSIFELAERLERVGVTTETRIDVKRMQVSTVLFVGEGARLPGSRVGLRPRDRGPEFWSLERRPPVRTGPDGRVFSELPPSGPKAPDPNRIGEGLNEGVTDLVAALNQGDIQIAAETVAHIRCGRDGWSRMGREDLFEILLTEFPEGQIRDAIEGFGQQDQGAALRWMCRGLSPERTRALHLLRRDLREGTYMTDPQDLSPTP